MTRKIFNAFHWFSLGFQEGAFTTLYCTWYTCVMLIALMCFEHGEQAGIELLRGNIMKRAWWSPCKPPFGIPQKMGEKSAFWPKVVREPISKVSEGFSTATSTGIMFLIDLATGQTPLTLQTFKNPKVHVFGNFKMSQLSFETLDAVPNLLLYSFRQSS